jgi:two-component system cell cycle sensor histidine kinase/response regulator CckA
MAVGLLWIWGSDWLVQLLARGNLQAIHHLQSAKGAGFIAGTGLALYLAIAATHRRERRLREDQRSTADRLMVSQRLEALGTLAGTVAHDFNNVVMIIRGAAEMARLEGYDPHSLPYHLQTVERAADQANQMVRQMMSFMRNSPAIYSREKMDDVVREILPVLQQAAGRGVLVELSAGADLPPVRVDRSQVERTLLNLVVNARDASAQAREKRILVTVTKKSVEHYVSFFQQAAVSGDFLVISVSDRGCGIRRDDFERIFSPFYTTKNEGEGTGLGLTSVAGVMQCHGGWVELDSEVGQGSCFTLFFPCEPAQKAAAFVTQPVLAPLERVTASI